MRVTYDSSVDAIYIELVSAMQDGVAKTYPCDPTEVGGMINLDFDSTGRLIGIEVLDARNLLPPEILEIAEE